MIADYVIVGAGSAGCVLASRLTEDPDCRVILIEAGPEPKNFWIGVPAGVSRLIFPSDVNWGYFTEPVPSLNNRKVYAPRGRTLGGSSAINGMAFVRGAAADFESWQELGNPGWSYADVLPYFKKIETRADGDPTYRGGDGPLFISDPAIQHPTTRNFLRAAHAAGAPHNRDYNAAELEGSSFLQQNIKDGRRHSVADAYLLPVRNRPNLIILTSVTADSLLIEGSHAVGVQCTRGGRPMEVRAAREVIVSAGAIGSPALLQRSGIGDGARLREAGIATRVDLPGVGRNLQDHMYINLRMRTVPNSSVNRQIRGPRTILHGIRYLLTRKGLLTMTAAQAAAFLRVMPDASGPDVQVMFRPYNWALNPNGKITVPAEDSVAASFTPLRPDSRGDVRLRSAATSDAPMINPNYLETERDRAVVVAGFRAVRRIFAADPLAAQVVTEISPGEGCESDGDILAFVRQTAESMHHWCGTCRMGSDPMAVVDSGLKVRRMEGLRVVDASIMPHITSGNINAPTIMIAEKGADLIRTGAASAS